MHTGLGEDHLDMLWVTLLEFPLQITATMLVLAQAIQFTQVMLQRHVAKTRKLGRIIVTTTAGTDASGRWVGKTVIVIRGISCRVRAVGSITGELAIYLHWARHVRLQIVIVEWGLKSGKWGGSNRACQARGRS
jgi:hypothetical protein